MFSWFWWLCYGKNEGLALLFIINIFLAVEKKTEHCVLSKVQKALFGGAFCLTISAHFTNNASLFNWLWSDFAILPIKASKICYVAQKFISVGRDKGGSSENCSVSREDVKNEYKFYSNSRELSIHASSSIKSFDRMKSLFGKRAFLKSLGAEWSDVERYAMCTARYFSETYCCKWDYVKKHIRV